MYLPRTCTAADGYTSDSMHISWLNGDKSVGLDDNVQLPEFNLTKFVVGDCSAVFETGSCSR